MNKKSVVKSGFFNPRIFGAFVLLTFGISLGVFSFAAPKPASRKNTAQNASAFQPTVIQSIYNGVSSAVRDLPKASSVGENEHEPNLPPVKATHPVPAGFVDAARQSSAAAAAAPTPNLTFEGQSSVDSGGSPAGCICTPPDTNGAVGPTQYVQMVNSVFSVYNKDGTRLSGPTQINALWDNLPGTCKANNNGDPVVVYDQLADRWLISQFAVPTNDYHECIAISKGPDAAGEYYIYDFPLSKTKWQDYPHFGLWPDAYYMTMHQFTPAGDAYLGQAAWAFERDRMLKGQPAQLIYFDLGTLNLAFGGQLPSNLDGFTLPPAGAPNYFVEVDSSADTGLGANLRIWKFHVDWNTPANSSFGVSGQPNSIVPVTDFARPNCTVSAGGCVPQLGSAGQLDSLGDRLMYRAAYRNFGDHESLVINHTVVANAVNGQATQFGPRWYEVRDPGGSPAIFQQSTFGPTGQTDLLYRWMSSVAMDRTGDMAIGYSTSSAASFPSIAYAGRLSTDPANTLAQGETQMFAGTGPQHNEVFIPFSPTGFGRWGDYTDMTVDPVDDCTFWYTNMYYSSTDAPAGIWHTRVGNFKFPQCTPRQVGFLRGTVTDSATGNPLKGASITAGGYTAIANDSGFYQFSPLGPGSYTDAASATGYFSSSASVTVTNGGITTRDFALVRNQAVPTPTPAPPKVLQTVNPPVLNDPGNTITTNNYTLIWSPAEVTTGLDHYVIEESTDYVNPLFDNADGTNLPGQAGSLWNTGDDTGDTAGWVQNPTYHNSVPNSYEGPAPGPVPLQFDPNLTLKNNITIPANAGSARLTFYSRYFNGPDDTGNVEISTDSGFTWSSLKVLTDSPLPPPADTRMQSHEVDLTSYKGIPFKLRFRFDGGSTVNLVVLSVGWWLDDINVDGGTWTQIGTTGPTTTSLNVTNKPNGHYYYRVRGVYTNGNSTTNSNVQDIVVNFPLNSVASRMTHGGTPFDVNFPFTGARGVECRSSAALGAGNYAMVFTFPNNLVSVASASVASHDPSNATGTVSGSPIVSGNQCTVNLTNVSDGQYISVTLNSVLDTAGDSGNVTSRQLGILIGDVNANGLVNSTDTSVVQTQSGQPVTSSNFRTDINANGLINSTDTSLVRSESGTGLPSSP
jgi:hypothetical protein